MKVTVGLVLAGLLLAPAAHALTIAEVRVVDVNCEPVYLGSMATVENVLIVSGSELGSAGPAYFEDPTAGMCMYTYPIGVSTGDICTITGEIGFYRGLIQFVDDALGNPPTVTIHSSGNTVTPHLFTIPQMNDANEGKLIKFECVRFLEGGDTTFYYTHKFVDAAGDTGVMYTDLSTDVDGQPIPAGWVNLTGCLGQYDNSGPSYCEGYQVIPRSIGDIEYTPSAAEKTSWSGVKAMYR